jgi:hypothetical protein
VAEPPVMDLHDADATVKHLIRDRDGRYTTAFDTVFEDDSIAVREYEVLMWRDGGGQADRGCLEQGPPPIWLAGSSGAGRGAV